LGFGIIVAYALGVVWVLYYAWDLSGGVFSRIFPSADENGIWAVVFQTVVSTAAAMIMFGIFFLVSAIAKRSTS
jgi:hypothetical protein